MVFGTGIKLAIKIKEKIQGILAEFLLS